MKYNQLKVGDWVKQSHWDKYYEVVNVGITAVYLKILTMDHQLPMIPS